MADIYLGLGILFGLSITLVFLGLFLDRRFSKRASLIAITLTIVALFLYAGLLRESALLARILPFSNLIVVGNWLILFGAFLTGLVANRIPGGRIRRGIYCTLLLAACTFTLIAPLIGTVPKGGDYWTREGVTNQVTQYAVAMQSSDSSCSAACAATLLRTVGIKTSEQEMIDLCLTHTNGTLWFGLYRGLKLKTAGTPYDVEILHATPTDLKSGALKGPLILSVRLDLKPGIDERYEKKWGWAPGVAHSVVFFRTLPDNLVEMGDPSIGREKWGFDGIETLWHGDAMRLVPRRAQAGVAP